MTVYAIVSAIRRMLGPGGNYLNFSGCGNTVNCNHPIVRELILTCLRFWVGEEGFGVDEFVASLEQFATHVRPLVVV